MSRKIKPNIQNPSEKLKQKLVIVSELDTNTISASESESIDIEEDMSLLRRELSKNNCQKLENLYDPESKCNKFLLRKEFLESEELAEDPNADPFLYPNLNDPNFSIKIAEKAEFADNKIDGTIYEDVKKRAEELANADFELAPQQAFVRNFLSFQTPYNSMLLYHQLGTGKTCSAIGVTEEMRDYMKQMGLTKRIIIVASPNVQDNFRRAIFDDRKLKLVDGLWNIRDCTGNKLLKEINPMNMKGITKEKVISQIGSLINASYIFLGYVEFANYILKTESGKPKGMKQEKRVKGTKAFYGEYKNASDRARQQRRNLQAEFNGRLVVIDEIHNIRIAGDSSTKFVADALLNLVKSTENMRILLLSATPMYNDYKEIIWLLNLMNANDKRATIEIKDVFDKNGDFKKNSVGEEIGKELLIRKAIGYVSFVKGENPYTFPFKIWPMIFSPQNTFKEHIYPSYQMNGRKIEKDDKLKFLDVYLINIGSYQSLGYKFIIDNLKNKKITITTKTGVIKDMPNFENMDSFGYVLLTMPLESLIMVYPIDGLESAVKQIADEGIVVEEERSHSGEKPIYLSEVLVQPEPEEAEAESEEPDAEEPDAEKPDADSGLEKKSKDESFAKLYSFEEANVEDEEEPEERTIFDEYMPKSAGENEDENEEIEINETEVDEEPEYSHTDIDDLPQDVKLLRNRSSLSSIESIGGKSVSDGKSMNGGSGKRGKLKVVESSESETSMGDIYISPNDLVGKKGLERLMTFVDSNKPPVKGSFEYKPTTLKNYGRIFSPDEIGKYSSKIKNICENVLNSEGIALIYSQYIDAALVPMALALEEYGFSRFGEGAKSLFKSPPGTRSKGLKYCMITGDPRLSPNNDFEVKAITSEDNMNGEKIKVVLISQAGTEGIDFKFLRQIHILEPWYNMSRIEQIIGRAVRNFSHKSLPFEQRNVQIFLYGTLLENQRQEAADLYVYRVAEYKAQQIGQVSRVLKENAVDCIINHNQTKFTQEIMDIGVTQVLSTGQTIEDFKIGDAPYSAACDYMECDYNCRPDKEIGEPNDFTYNEAFIAMNAEKILKKIRMLFKERYFYLKKDLIHRMNIPKPYPLVQIYAGLTQLVEDSSEFITDKYGRNGYLVNIGEYYLFQPSELNNEKISIFDRSIPIDYKPDSIKFDIKRDAMREVIDVRNIQEIGELEPPTILSSNPEAQNEQPLVQRNATTGIKVLEKMKSKFDIAIESSSGATKIQRGEEEWYKYCGIAMKKLIKDLHYNNKVVLEILVEHLVDMLESGEKVDLLNYLYVNEVEHNSFEDIVKKYLEGKIIKTKRLIGYVLYEKDKIKYVIWNDSKKKWVPAEPEDERDLNMLLSDKYSFKKDDYSELVGFIGQDQKKTYLIFKIKDIKATRNTGARCDEAGKMKKLQVLNSILGFEKYDKDNTKGMGQAELCTMIEFILRNNNNEIKEGKIWFLDIELAALNNFL
jgi:superfamily II DNA or RNA helicase